MPQPEKSEDPLVYDRRTKTLFREVVLGGGVMRWAYTGPVNRLCREVLFRTGFLSRLLGWYADSFLSRGRIRGTIKALAIDESEFRDPVSAYRSFNAFFCRHLRPGVRPFDPDSSVLC